VPCPEIVNGSSKDLVYMGAEHGDLYAIDVASGKLAAYTG